MLRRPTLLETCRRLRRLIESTAVPVDGGRLVRDDMDAKVLSDAADDVYAAARSVWDLLVPAARGFPGLPPGITLEQVCSRTGEAKPIPPKAIVAYGFVVGTNAASPLRLAALRRVTESAGFPTQLWNALQFLRPGDDHERYHAGDIIPHQDLAALASAEELLILEEEANPGWDADAPNVEGRIAKLIRPPATPSSTSLLPVSTGNAAGAAAKSKTRAAAWERLTLHRSSDGSDHTAELGGKRIRIRGDAAFKLLHILKSKQGGRVKASVLAHEINRRPDQVVTTLDKRLQRIIEAPKKGSVGYAML